MTEHRSTEGTQFTRLVRRAEREQKARIEAENLLEAKSRELYLANQKLADLARHLERRVEERSRELMQERERVTAFADKVISSEHEIAEQGNRLEAALKNMPTGLSMFDAKGRLIICNERYAKLYDLPPALTKPGTRLEEIMLHTAIPDGGDAAGRIDAQRADFAACLKSSGRLTYTRRLPNGRSIRFTVGPLACGGWVGVHEDITERLVLEERIARLAAHDPLTGLPNRRLLSERLGEAFVRADRGDEVAVLYLDLDNFKDINDAFGHTAGDELLCAVARRFEETLEDCFIARVGGDEFTVVIWGKDAVSAGKKQADRILKAFLTPFHIWGQHPSVGVSIGGAVYPHDASSSAALLIAADAALYRAKTDGRHRARFFDHELDSQIKERSALQHDLHSAVERGEFLVHYQPLAHIDGRVFGFEALARWQHPRRGLVSPSTFIPLAESSGMVSEIGEWILRETCREAASWPVPLQVAVNLSPAQLRDGDLASLIHLVLLETGLSPQRLELEITEGVLISDPQRVLSILRRIKTLGVRVAMDDFGTGYASLSSLQAFPFDKIKIDRSFVANVDINSKCAAIVRSVIGLGRALKIPVLAEGVETEAERTFLQQEGCESIQGYLVGRPEPISFYGALTRVPPEERGQFSQEARSAYA